MPTGAQDAIEQHGTEHTEHADRRTRRHRAARYRAHGATHAEFTLWAVPAPNPPTVHGLRRYCLGDRNTVGNMQSYTTTAVTRGHRVPPNERLVCVYAAAITTEATPMRGAEVGVAVARNHTHVRPRSPTCEHSRTSPEGNVQLSKRSWGALRGGAVERSYPMLRTSGYPARPGDFMGPLM